MRRRREEEGERKVGRDDGQEGRVEQREGGGRSGVGRRKKWGREEEEVG